MTILASLLMAVVLVPVAYSYAASLDYTYDWLVRQQGLDPSKQSACASGPTGTLFSYNGNLQVIPASVSKLYLFDFALSKLPTSFRYTTTFVLSGKTLYINGAGDPQMADEHLQSVLDRINADGNPRITTVVVSPNFYFDMTKNWSSIGVSIEHLIPGAAVIPAASSYDGEGVRYQFQSIPLPAFLKNTSNYSNNFFADTLFTELGGVDAFADYMMRTYGIGSETTQFSTGSGLSGNYTTCTQTLRTLEHLDKALAARQLSLTDVMTMPVVDPGVLSTRAIDSTAAESLVAKSGYLTAHHNLAGIINSDQGHVYFATFTDYPSTINGTAVNALVDQFTNDILSALGPSLVSLGYNPDPSVFENFRISLK